MKTVVCTGAALHVTHEGVDNEDNAMVGLLWDNYLALIHHYQLKFVSPVGYNYKNHSYSIHWHSREHYFCGYVAGVPDEEEGFLYQPHGEFSGGYSSKDGVHFSGFDCAHATDYYTPQWNLTSAEKNDPVGTFKMEEFVHAECIKIIEAMIAHQATTPLPISPLPISPLPISPLPISPLPISPLPISPLPILPPAMSESPSTTLVTTVAPTASA